MIRALWSPRWFFLLVFLMGLGVGAWGMRLYFDRTLGSWDPVERFAAKLTEDLRLTPAQRRQVGGILTSQRRKMEDLRDRWRGDVRVLSRQGEDQIAGLLTGEQLDTFMRLHDRIHGRMDLFLWASETKPTAVALSEAGPVR